MNFHEGKAGIGAFLPNADMLDTEPTAKGSYLIENLGQNEAIDDVPADFDVFHGAMEFCGYGFGHTFTRKE
jgi:hypothetical protein